VQDDAEETVQIWKDPLAESAQGCLREGSQAKTPLSLASSGQQNAMHRKVRTKADIEST